MIYPSFDIWEWYKKCEWLIDYFLLVETSSVCCLASILCSFSYIAIVNGLPCIFYILHQLF